MICKGQWIDTSSWTATTAVSYNHTNLKDWIWASCSDSAALTSSGVTWGSVSLPALPAPAPAPAPPPSSFNKFVNASDVLATFAKFAEIQARVGRMDFLELPLKYFVQWLVLEAAELDGDPPPEGIEPTVRIPKRHRCRACGRFIPTGFRALGLNHCNPMHMQLTLVRTGVAP